MPERLASDKHSRLLQKFTNYGQKTLKLTPGACSIKIWIHNLRKMDRFRSKLVSFLLSVTFSGLYKHTTLLQNLYITNP